MRLWCLLRNRSYQKCQMRQNAPSHHYRPGAQPVDMRRGGFTQARIEVVANPEPNLYVCEPLNISIIYKVTRLTYIASRRKRGFVSLLMAVTALANHHQILQHPKTITHVIIVADVSRMSPRVRRCYSLPQHPNKKKTPCLITYNRNRPYLKCVLQTISPPSSKSPDSRLFPNAHRPNHTTQ